LKITLADGHTTVSPTGRRENVTYNHGWALETTDNFSS
jgi:hypothetical protein